MNMTDLFWMCLVLFTSFSEGCYFEGDDPDGFYQRAPKLRSQLLMKTTAGPFEIKNVISKSNSSNSYNHYSQGVDWPKKFETCAGRKQSPIVIDHKITKNNDINNLPPLKFVGYGRFHPHMVMINNGHTVDVLGPWGTGAKDVPTMSGGPLKGSYILRSVHFHWGHHEGDGAEHIIHGRHYAVEMHFVHYKSDYKSIGEAIAANRPDSLAVVALLFKPSSRIHSPYVKEMFKTLDMAVRGDVVNPPVFPLNLVNRIKSYYTYDGSLTTPDCNEIVKWIVVHEPILTADSLDLAVFKKYLKDGKPIKGTYRRTQNLNNRKVYRSSNQRRCVGWKIKYIPIFLVLIGFVGNL